MKERIWAVKFDTPGNKLYGEGRSKTDYGKDGEVMRVALTAKQQAFVDEYLVDLNATQAAIRAGYSVKDADKIGTVLLRNTRIKAAIDKAMAERSRVICY